MIEPFLALAVTVVALGWIVWRLRHYRPRNRGRLIGVLVLMVLVAFAVELFLPAQSGSRIQLWFGSITAVMMAVATLVETEPKEQE